jgi:hypothetical protein
MVMSDSHYLISSFPSQDVKKAAMEQKLKADYFFSEENLDTLNMIPTTPLDKVEISHYDLDCPIVTYSPCMTDIEQYFFPIIDGSFIETSCYNNSCDFLPSSNDEYVLQYISYPCIVQEQDSHTNFFTSREEINMQDTPLLSQQSNFNLGEENRIEEEHVDCETTPTIQPTNSQSSNGVFKEEELPFRESLSENPSCSREVFHSFNFSTYFYLYLDVLTHPLFYSNKFNGVNPF